MYALAIIRYRRPLEEMLPHVEAHRTYLRSLQTRGLLLASGPLEPRTGGALLLRLGSDEPHAALDAIRDGDPFVIHGIAQYGLLLWNPGIGVEALDRL
jgi:uncharacterized protein YciI